MHTTTLRNVDGSVMLSIPPAFLEILRLHVGAKVCLSIEAGRLVIEPRPHPRDTLDQLLAQCDPNAPISNEDRDWLHNGPAGQELL